MKYVCFTKRYHNCRAHDSGSYSGLVFFDSLKDILNAMLKDFTYEFVQIYSTHKGQLICTPIYELSGHGCAGINIKIKNKSFKTIDDGHGNKLWSKI